MNAVEDKFPLVSVIVRTKDRPHLLREALKSIAAQSYSNIEIIGSIRISQRFLGTISPHI